jgi:hypothetical protein
MPIDPVVNLVRQAIGYGVMMATEGKSDLVDKLSALPANGNLPDALTSDAEKFVAIRSDLVEALHEYTRSDIDQLLTVATLYVNAFSDDELMTLPERMRLQEIESILAKRG